jgi:hypothetical protein
MISLMQRPLPDYTQHPQETDIHAWQDLNPYSQQANGHRSTPDTVRPLGSACGNIKKVICTQGKVVHIHEYEQPVHRCLHRCRQFTQTNGLSSMCQAGFEKILSGVTLLCGCSSEMQQGKWGECVMFNLYKFHPIQSDAIKTQET